MVQCRQGYDQDKFCFRKRRINTETHSLDFICSDRKRSRLKIQRQKINLKEQDHERVGFKKPWKEMRDNDKDNEFRRKAFQLSPTAHRYGHRSDKNISKPTLKNTMQKAISLQEKIEAKLNVTA